ncbi:MAG: phage protease [Candidatus Bipolaricaulota bacterium]|nr:phage protease [Candidatus Bipolaricaulota bacterium]
MEKLQKLCEELGIALPEGVDPVEALRAYIAKLRQESTQLAEVATKLSETQTALRALEERARKAEEEKKALEKRIFFEEMIRAGKLTPAERPHLERLYDRDPEGMRAWLNERPAVVDLKEYGSSAGQVPSLEERRLNRMRELIRSGMNAADAYTVACREIAE